MAFGPDGRLLVTGSGTRHSVSLGNGNHVSYSDGAVALWNLADRSHPDRVDTVTLTGSANDGKVHAVAFSPDGRLIATTGDPGTAVLWNVSDASRLTRAATLGIAKWYESIVYALAFSPGGRLLATGRNDKTVVLWEISDPRHPARIAAFHASDGLRGLQPPRPRSDLEVVTFLEGYLLHSQGDRMLMGNSVEGRSPISTSG